MTIIVLSNCPAKLRGDLTKWFFEINTGVYVGNVSNRVRELLWCRICENIKTGQATMVYSSDNEQRFSFRVHNTVWQVADFDGIELMLRPSLENIPGGNSFLKEGFSNSSKQKLLSNLRRAQEESKIPESFVVMDIETTGLDPQTDSILEIAAIRVRNNQTTDIFCELITIKDKIPEKITELTGITDEMLCTSGKSIKLVLEDLLAFIENDFVVCHNAIFDMEFLRISLQKNNLPQIQNKIIDTLTLSRKKLKHIKKFTLLDIAKHFQIDVKNSHRALDDCETLLQVYMCLSEC